MALYTNVIAQPKKLLGGDVSLLPSYEAQNTVYKDFNGRKVSFLPFVKQQGWNAIRVRLFVDPANAPDGQTKPTGEEGWYAADARLPL